MPSTKAKPEYLTVCVVGGNSQYIEYFKELGKVVEVRQALDILGNEEQFYDVDLFVLTGGADVDPAWYSHAAHKKTSSYLLGDRERNEAELYYHFMGSDVPFVGVCRGAQFLAVLNGCSLYQDVQGHLVDHFMYTKEGSCFKVTSTHHQMVNTEDYSGSDLELLAWGKCSSFVESQPTKDLTVTHDLPKDPEVFKFNATQTLCVQGHPEFTSASEVYKQYILSEVRTLVQENREYKANKKANKQSEKSESINQNEPAGKE